MILLNVMIRNYKYSPNWFKGAIFAPYIDIKRKKKKKK